MRVSETRRGQKPSKRLTERPSGLTWAEQDFPTCSSEDLAMEHSSSDMMAGTSPPLAPPASVRSVGAFHPPRVLIYTTCYNVIDGVTLTIRKIEQEILASGGHVFILTTQSGNRANTHVDGTHPNRRVVFLDSTIPVPFLQERDADTQYCIGFSLSSAVRAKIEEFGPTIIHITVPDCTALHLVQYARTKEIPLMGTYHSNIPEYMDHYRGMGWVKPVLGYFFRHQYNFMQALYVPTPFIRRQLCDKYQLDRVTNLGIWGRGVDVQKFSPAHRSNIFRQKLGIDDDDVVITFVGRLVPEKRPDIFANVVRRLHARNVPFHALVVGMGPYEEEFRILPNTTCTGWLTGNDLPVAYASSDVFLFPSAVETFGNVTLEAAASGLPLVVEAGCSGHLVSDGVNGYACQADDEDAFFEATLALIVDQEKRNAFSAESRTKSLSLEKGKVTRRMLGNYSRVTEEFETEYGGHHRNRDNIYRNKDSFSSGTHPRPLTLVLIESLFFLLFRIMWFFMSGVFWFQDVIMMSAHLQSQDQESLANFTHATSAPTYTNSQSGKVDALASMGKNSQIEMLDIHDDTMSVDSDVELSSTEEGSTGLLKSSTPSVTSTEQDDSVVGSNSRPILRSPSCSRKCGDDSLSAALALAFVRCVMFQGRMESRLRNAIRDWCSREPQKQWNGRSHARKRKYSSSASDATTSLALSSPREDSLGHRRRNSLPLLA